MYSGGTSLATQRECLDTLGCYGEERVNRLAEFIAAGALAGEISLAAAISACDRVASHEKFSRNR
jgi:hydroxymethylglutaryl-CoA reductase (NADPH)